MNKKSLYNLLIPKYNIQKSKNKSYDFEILVNDKLYTIKCLKIARNTQLTINSRLYFELATGTKDGLRFIKKTSQLINLVEYSKNDNKIIFLLDHPFRKLKYLNESDVVDISNENSVYDYHLFESIDDFETL